MTNPSPTNPPPPNQQGNNNTNHRSNHYIYHALDAMNGNQNYQPPVPHFNQNTRTHQNNQKNQHKNNTNDNDTIMTPTNNTTMENDKRKQFKIKITFNPETKTRQTDGTWKTIPNPVSKHLKALIHKMILLFPGKIVVKSPTTKEEVSPVTFPDEEITTWEEFDVKNNPNLRSILKYSALILVETNESLRAIKNAMFNWLKTHKTFINDHPFESKNIEFTRIGFLQGKHPGETYRIELQEQLNNKIIDHFTAGSSASITEAYLQYVDGYTTDQQPNFPTVRIINQNIRSNYQGQEVTTRALTLEVPKHLRNLTLAIMHMVIPATEKYLFIPFNLQNDQNIPNAPLVFHEAVKNHKQMIAETFCFSILNVSEETMVKNKINEKTMIQELRENSYIDAVERTPGTSKSGKWTIITTKERRDDAEKVVDEILQEHLQNIPTLSQQTYKPRRIQSSSLPFQYVHAILKKPNNAWKSQAETISTLTGTTAPSTTYTGDDGYGSMAYKRFSDDMSMSLKSLDEKTSAFEERITQSITTFEEKTKGQSDQFDKLFLLISTINENIEKNDKRFDDMTKRQEAQEDETNKLRAKVIALETELIQLKVDKEKDQTSLDEFKAQTSHQICVLQQKLDKDSSHDSDNEGATDNQLKKKLSVDNTQCSGNESPKKACRVAGSSTARPTHDYNLRPAIKRIQHFDDMDTTGGDADNPVQLE